MNASHASHSVEAPVMNASHASHSVEAPNGLISKRPRSAMKRSSQDHLRSIPENRELLRPAHGQRKAPSPGTLLEDATTEILSVNSTMFLRPDFVTSTSYDERFPAERLGLGQTCWVSTGLFPHEITLMFKHSPLVSRVVVASSGVRSMTLQWSLASSGSRRELREPAIPPGSGVRGSPCNKITFDVGGSPCDKIIVRMDSAYDDFCIVFTLECWGALPER